MATVMLLGPRNEQLKFGDDKYAFYWTPVDMAKPLFS